MLRNMGTAAWGAFPQGTQLQLQQGAVPGVAGPSEPSEQLMALANRACDLLFLGQNLTTEQSGQGARAAAEVHREVELDLYENYAAFIVDLINDQLIPALIELNWGDRNELPFVEVEIPRPNRDQEKADRDKLLFGDLGLPVSLQYLYERHKVPAPAATDVLFTPRPSAPSIPSTTSTPVTSTKFAPCACGCGSPIEATAESAAELAARQQAAADAFPAQLAAAEAADEYLVWNATLDAVTTPQCQSRHGRRWGDGWFSPPPAHYNCRSTLLRVPKSSYQTTSS
jgi:phage gp29-like protein